MCMTCGCNLPDEDHGDDRNIVREKFEAAATAAGISVIEAAVNAVSTAALDGTDE